MRQKNKSQRYTSKLVRDHPLHRAKPAAVHVVPCTNEILTQRLPDARRLRLYNTWSRHTDLTHWSQRVSESIRANKPKWKRHKLKHVYTDDQFNRLFDSMHLSPATQRLQSKQKMNSQSYALNLLIHSTSVFLHLTLVDASILGGLGQMDIKDHQSHCLD